jgi:hypothetical protein
VSYDAARRMVRLDVACAKALVKAAKGQGIPGFVRQAEEALGNYFHERRARPPEPPRDGLRIACPYCKSDPGERCTMPDGLPYSFQYIHKSRSWKALK